MDPKLEAAYKYVESVSHTADYKDSHAWHGWALREAFLAGMNKAEEDSACARLVGEAVIAEFYRLNAQGGREPNWIGIIECKLLGEP